MQLTVYHAKSFTKDPSQGAPTGIVLDAEMLTDQDRLSIAKILKYSETTFIEKSDKANYKIKFFTPLKEMGLCAHASLAAFNLLVKLGRLNFQGEKTLRVTQETSLGVLPVIGYSDGLIVMTQKDPVFFNTENNKQLVANLLSISVNDIINQPLEIVSTGTPKLIVPVKDLKTLHSLIPNLEAIKEYSQNTEAKGVYVYTTECLESDSDFHARQFNPLAGINEDPITGVAAGALGCYVKKHHLSNKTKFIIEQGFIMKKAGKIYVDVTSDVKVGGFSINTKQEVIEI